MKRLLILAGIIVFGTFLVCGMVTIFFLFFSSDFLTPAPSPSVAVERVEPFDVDAMAARMPMDKDYYAKVRDQAQAFYLQEHPNAGSCDPEVKTSIGLAAYYVTWGDFYGERVLLDLARIEAQAQEEGGCQNAMLHDLQIDGWYDTHYLDEKSGAANVSREMLGEAEDGAPVALKMWGAQTAISATIRTANRIRLSRRRQACKCCLPSSHFGKSHWPNSSKRELPGILSSTCPFA